MYFKINFHSKSKHMLFWMRIILLNLNSYIFSSGILVLY